MAKPTKASEAATKLLDINTKLHGAMAKMNEGKKVEEDIATVPYVPLKAAYDAGVEAETILLKAKPGAVELDVIKKLTTALDKVSDIYPEEAGNLTMPADVASDLNMVIINHLAGKIHDAAMGFIGAIGELQACSVAELMPDEAAAVSKYCSGVLPALSKAVVHKVPVQQITIKGEKQFLTYPQQVEHQLGVHRTKISPLSQDGAAKVAVEYRESGPQYADMPGRQKGVSQRLTQEGLTCNVGKGEKIPFGKDLHLYCWGEVEKEKLRRLASFFSLLLNADVSHMGKDTAPVVKDKVWDIAGKLNQQYGDETWKSGQGQLDWSTVKSEWAQEKEIYEKKIIYEDLRNLTILRDRHHEIEAEYGIDKGAQSMPGAKAIVENGNKALALCKKNNWPTHGLEGAINSLENMVKDGNLGHLLGQSDAVGHIMHLALDGVLKAEGAYGGCSTTGDIDNINAGNLAYCEGVLKGTSASFTKSGNLAHHKVAPLTYSTFILDENPKGGYDVSITLPDGHWANSIAASLHEHQGFKCAGTQCKAYIDTLDKVRVLALLLSNLKAASEAIGAECADKALEEAREAAESQNEKGVFAFTQEPLMANSKAWIDLCHKKYGILPPGLTEEEKIVIELLGLEKAYCGCSFAHSEVIPNEGILTYCEGVRKNKVASINAILNAQGQLDHFFHGPPGAPDKIAQVNIIPLGENKYQVELGAISMMGDYLQQETIDYLKKFGFTCPTSTSCSSELGESDLRYLAEFLSSLHQAYKLTPECTKEAVKYVHKVIAALPDDKTAWEHEVYPFELGEWNKEVCAKVKPPEIVKKPPKEAVAVEKPPVAEKPPEEIDIETFPALEKPELKLFKTKTELQNFLLNYLKQHPGVIFTIGELAKAIEEGGYFIKFMDQAIDALNVLKEKGLITEPTTQHYILSKPEEEKKDLAEFTTKEVFDMGQQVCNWKEAGFGLLTVHTKFYEFNPVVPSLATTDWITKVYDACPEIPALEKIPSIDELIDESYKKLGEAAVKVTSELTEKSKDIKEYKKLPKAIKDHLHAYFNWQLLTHHQAGIPYEETVKALQKYVLQYFPLTPLMVKLQLDIEKKSKIRKGELPAEPGEKVIKYYTDLPDEEQAAINEKIQELLKEDKGMAEIIKEIIVQFGIGVTGLETAISTQEAQLLEEKPTMAMIATLWDYSEEIDWDDIPDEITHCMDKKVKTANPEYKMTTGVFAPFNLADAAAVADLSEDKIKDLWIECIQEYTGVKAVPEAKIYEELSPPELDLVHTKMLAMAKAGKTSGEILNEVLTTFNLAETEKLVIDIKSIIEMYGPKKPKDYTELNPSEQEEVKQHMKSLIDEGWEKIQTIKQIRTSHNLSLAGLGQLWDELKKEKPPVSAVAEAINLIKTGKPYAGCHPDTIGLGVELSPIQITYCEGIMTPPDKKKAGFVQFKDDTPIVSQYGDGYNVIATSPAADTLDLLFKDMEKSGKEWKKRQQSVAERLTEDLPFTCAFLNDEVKCGLEGLDKEDGNTIRTTANFLSRLHDIDELDAGCVDAAVRHALEQAKWTNKNLDSQSFKQTIYPYTKEEWNKEVCEKVQVAPVRIDAKTLAQQLGTPGLLDLAFKMGVDPSGSDEVLAKKLLDAGYLPGG